VTAEGNAVWKDELPFRKEKGKEKEKGKRGQASFPLNMMGSP
jgi:hypothetical protein